MYVSLQFYYCFHKVCVTTGKGSIVLSRQVPDEPMRLEEIYYNEVHSFCSVSSQPSTYYSTSPYVHSLPLFMALKKL